MSAADLTASQMLRSYAAGTLTPSAVVVACLDRIAKTEERVNAVVTLARDDALQAAEASDERWRREVPLPLDGVPFGVKDIIDTAGIRTTGGSALLTERTPVSDATAVARLKSAGAVVLAKLQTYEFAYGANPHFGPAHNPWDLTRTAGGSSEGPAASLAAGQVPLALGTDTGGSIRIPAAFCAVTGFKPTYDRVSRGGVLPHSWSLDHVGPMARSVEDCARAFDALAGLNGSEQRSRRSPTATADRLDWPDVPLRIGVPTNWFWDVLDPDVASAAREMAEVLAADGAEIVEVAVPAAELAEVVCWTIMAVEVASIHQGTWNHLDSVGKPLATLIAIGRAIEGADYVQALRARHLVQMGASDVFESCDVLLTPGVACTAPEAATMRAQIGEREVPWIEVVARTTMWHNVVGGPVLSLPAGFDRHGLPVSVQVAAMPGDDVSCLRAGYLVQQLTRHHELQPAIVGSLT